MLKTNIRLVLALTGLFTLTNCGQSQEEKNKTIEEAAALRANQYCTNGGGAEEYAQKVEYLTEQLTEKGLTEKADVEKAIELFDQKIKEICPDKDLK
jgi:hypothetical protein